MFGALGAHWICDRYGRRLSFIVAAASFILGIIIMACAWSYPVIMFGRVFVGLGVGFGLAVCFECLCLYVIALEIILMLFLPLFLIAWNTDWSAVHFRNESCCASRRTRHLVRNGNQCRHCARLCRWTHSRYKQLAVHVFTGWYLANLHDFPCRIHHAGNASLAHYKESTWRCQGYSHPIVSRRWELM